HPLFTGRRLWQWLLKLPHQLFPLLHLRIAPVSPRLLFKRKAVAHFHNHEQTPTNQVDFHVFDSGLSDALRNFRPDVLMMAFVLFDELRRLLQIESEAISIAHEFPLFRLREPSPSQGQCFADASPRMSRTR